MAKTWEDQMRETRLRVYKHLEGARAALGAAKIEAETLDDCGPRIERMVRDAQKIVDEAISEVR